MPSKHCHVDLSRSHLLGSSPRGRGGERSRGQTTSRTPSALTLTLRGMWPLSLPVLNPESRLQSCIRTRCVPLSASMRLRIRLLGQSPLVWWGRRDPFWPQSLQPCRQEGLAIGFSCDPPPRSSLRQTVFRGHAAYAIIGPNTLQLRERETESEREKELN